MSTKECRLKGMPWITPYLCVVDVDKAVEFYEKVFGFKRREEVSKNEKGESVHCELLYQDAMVMVGLEGAYGQSEKSPATSSVECPTSLYVYCEDVDEFCKKAKNNGAEILSEPEDTFWGDRMCRLKDLNGYTWSFATNKTQPEA